MHAMFIKGHQDLVSTNTLPSPRVVAQPTLSPCGIDLHGITALKGMLNEDIVTALLVDGRPLTMVNTFGRVLHKHSPHGGHAKESHNLRQGTYPNVVKEHHTAVEKAIQNEASDGIIVSADETTDSADNAVK